MLNTRTDRDCTAFRPSLLFPVSFHSLSPDPKSRSSPVRTSGPLLSPISPSADHVLKIEF